MNDPRSHIENIALGARGENGAKYRQLPNSVAETIAIKVMLTNAKGKLPNKSRASRNDDTSRDGRRLFNCANSSFLRHSTPTFYRFIRRLSFAGNRLFILKDAAAIFPGNVAIFSYDCRKKCALIN